MKCEKHIFELFWVAGQQAPMPRETSIDSDNPEDVYAYQTEVDALEAFREQLRGVAQKATGAIHDLPHIEMAPQVIERPWTVTEAGSRYVAWNVFAADSQGEEHFLSRKLLNIDGGVMWLEPIRSERAIKRVTPPQANIEAGVRCEDCRRFSHEQGQEWLNQVTHKHENGDDRMWRDVVQLIAEHQNVEAPNNLADFGACLEDQKLVLRDYPGCAKYSKRAFKRGTECPIAGPRPQEVNGEFHRGQ